MKIIITTIIFWLIFQGIMTFYVMPTGVRLCNDKGGIMTKSAYGYTCVDKNFNKINY